MTNLKLLYILFLVIMLTQVSCTLKEEEKLGRLYSNLEDCELRLYEELILADKEQSELYKEIEAQQKKLDERAKEIKELADSFEMINQENNVHVKINFPKRFKHRNIL